MATEQSPVRRHPEDVAAFVNAMIVLLLPPALLMAAMFVFPSNSVAIRPERSFYASTGVILNDLAIVMVPLVPLSVLAGWRTWVHARWYCDRREEGWQGVVESGVAGFVAALLVLSGGILTRGKEALPYISVYAGGAALLGLAFGLLLRTTALIVLKRLGARSNSTAR